jgi:hypothetical protein
VLASISITAGIVPIFIIIITSKSHLSHHPRRDSALSWHPQAAPCSHDLFSKARHSSDLPQGVILG